MPRNNTVFMGKRRAPSKSEYWDVTLPKYRSRRNWMMLTARHHTAMQSSAERHMEERVRAPSEPEGWDQRQVALSGIRTITGRLRIAARLVKAALC
jgi:hypothetical protein